MAFPSFLCFVKEVCCLSVIKYPSLNILQIRMVDFGSQFPISVQSLACCPGPLSAAVITAGRVLRRAAHLQETKADTKKRDQGVEIFLPLGLTPNSFNTSHRYHRLAMKPQHIKGGRELDDNSL